MSRLPTVGGDTGSWGIVLNDFLGVSHNSDGTLLASSVGVSQLAAHAVTAAAIADGTITTTQLAGSIQTSLTRADNATLVTTVASTVTSSGTATIQKHNPVDATSANLSIALPTATTAGQRVSIEKIDTVTATGSIRGVGSSSLVLTLQHQTVELLSDASLSWWPQSGFTALGTLDTRYTTAGSAVAQDGSGTVQTITVVTAAAYAALSSPSATTMYVIVG
jgi:hypothetical protein